MGAVTEFDDILRRLRDEVFSPTNPSLYKLRDLLNELEHWAYPPPPPPETIKGRQTTVDPDVPLWAQPESPETNGSEG